MKVSTNAVLSVTVTALLTLGMASGVGATQKQQPKKSHGITETAAAQQYVALTKPLDVADRDFALKAKAWTNSTTAQEGEAEAQPAIAALTHFDEKLLTDKWPAADEADIKKLIRNDASAIADLKSLANVNVRNASAWLTKWKRDEQTIGTDAAIVRSDLGLPSN